MADTRTDLICRLMDLPACTQRDELIQRARSGAFHDFKSDSATPKRDLTHALAAIATKAPTSKLPGMTKGAAEISADVMAGKFDEEPDADDVDALADLLK